MPRTRGAGRPGEWELRFTRNSSTIGRYVCLGRAVRIAKVQANAMGSPVEFRRIRGDGMPPLLADFRIHPEPQKS